MIKGSDSVVYYSEQRLVPHGFATARHLTVLGSNTMHKSVLKMGLGNTSHTIALLMATSMFLHPEEDTRCALFRLSRR